MFAVLAGLGFATPASPNSGNQPTFVTQTFDNTILLLGTTAICGFPVYENDAGTVRTMITTSPDGSVRFITHAEVDVIYTFFSTDPNHPGVATAKPSGPFIETDNPDGSATLRSIGSNGHVTIPGVGIVYGTQGIDKLIIDASGNVTEVTHGYYSDTHAGICPLL